MASHLIVPGQFFESDMDVLRETGWASTFSEAIAAWNTRAALAVGGEEFDALIRTHDVASQPWDIRYVSVEDARKLYAELAATRAGKSKQS